jgi:hypothetical protein
MVSCVPVPRQQVADLAQCHPAATWAGRGRRVDYPVARQVLGQRSARRPAPFEGGHSHSGRHGYHLGRRVRLRRIRLQIGQLQLELVE